MLADFAEQLAAAMQDAAVNRRQLATRLNVSTQEIGFWLRGDRIPDADRQRAILAACRAPEPTVAWVVEELERDIAKRLQTFRADLETVIGRTTVTPGVAEQVVGAIRPKPKRQPR